MSEPKSKSEFSAPTCLRWGPHDNPEGDGFAFVADGVIVVHHDLKSLTIFEHEECHNNDDGSAKARFFVNLQSSAVRLNFKKIRSSNSNFLGGRVVIEDGSNQGLFARVIIKTETDEHLRLGRLLKQLLKK